MKSRKKYKLLIIATTISLIASLVFTATAIADDATPPPETEEPILPSTLEPVATVEVVLPSTTDTVVTAEAGLLPTMELVTTIEPVVEVIPTTLPELLEQIPIDTTVIVVVDGQIEPLVTQEAANTFVMGDPIWCPDGDPPIPGVGNCTNSYLDLFSLIDDIDNGIISQPAEDGTIWIMGGNDTSPLDITIDGSSLNFTTWSNYSLTLQGGWDGTSTIGSNISGTSVFSVPLSIVNWGGEVIVNQITVDGANSIGLEIETSGDITLDGVSSVNNAGNGAELTSLGSVTLTGVNIFDDNDSTGLYISAVDDIEAGTLSASSNGLGGVLGNGAELYSTLGSVTLTGVNTFADNFDSGLYVESFSDIEISDTTASGNGSSGAELTSSSGGVTLIGANSFTNNDVTGLFVDAVGDVDAENITASDNGANGADLNSSGGGVYISGSNIFNDNDTSGLTVDVLGDIDIANVTASGNGASGVSGDGADLNSSSGGVVLTGSNVFEDNYDNGLFVDAVGDIDAENVTANGNGASGADLSSSGGGVLLLGTNIFNDNILSGLVVDSLGDVDIENITASNNGAGGISGSGAELNSSAGSVSLVGINIFEDNYENGLFVDVAVDIDAENITATGNGSNGADLNSSSGGAFLTGTNTFNDNNTSGLIVDTLGDIDSSNVTANNNGANGADLSSSGGGIFISGTNIFNDNNTSGLTVDALGDVSVENATASSNGSGGVSGSGAELNSSTGSVSLIGSNIFEDNYDNGLIADAVGDIDAENVTASGNGAIGADLSSSGGGVLLLGTNIFSDNALSGLVVDSLGNIDVESINASNNGIGGISGSGAELSSSTGSVSLVGSNFFEANYDNGLFVDASIGIDAENITANGNGANGADLNSSGDVSLSGDNTFTDNNTSGLVVDAFGDIDSSNVTASNNGAGGLVGSGAELNTSTGNVTLTGINIFENNNNNGLLVDSGGNIEAENITANNNGNTSGNGAELLSLGSISLTGTNTFTNNLDVGLLVDALGDVDVENVTANGNTVGAELNVSGSLLITGVNVFNANNSTGLYVDAVGDVNAENLTANDNGLIDALGNGVEVYTLGGFYLIGTNVFDGNNNTGLYVDAAGDIDVENITADGNGIGGVFGNGAEFYSLGSFTMSGTNVFDNNYSDGLFVHSVAGVTIDDTYASFNGGNGIYIETDGNASVTCGILHDNVGYEIEADLPGVLTLNGVDFGGNVDNNVGADEDRLVLVSNNCFTYPPVNNEEDEDEEVDEDDEVRDAEPLPPPVLPINNMLGKDGQTINLDCVSFSGTLLTLLNGDGAYIPCQIVDSARLVKLPVEALPGDLPVGTTLVSSFNLSITKDGQVLQPLDMPSSIWYSNTQDPASQVIYWNGSDWVDAEDKIYPFLRVFFAIPENLNGANLAILYWDGLKWVELLDNQNIGDGRIIQKGGHVSAAGFFEGSVNFIGTFVFVQK